MTYKIMAGDIFKLWSKYYLLMF